METRYITFLFLKHVITFIVLLVFPFVLSYEFMMIESCFFVCVIAAQINESKKI